MLDGQRGLDQAGHAGGGVEVADVALDGTHQAVADAVARGPKRLRQRGNLDRIADRRGRAVALDVGQRVGADVGHRQRLGHAGGLAVDAGCQVADLARTVVVDRAALDHGMDVITVAQCIGQATHHHHAGAAAEHRAFGAVVEAAAMAVGREHLALLVVVAHAVWNLDRRAAGQRHVALA